MASPCPWKPLTHGIPLPMALPYPWHSLTRGIPLPVAPLFSFHPPTPGLPIDSPVPKTIDFRAIPDSRPPKQAEKLTAFCMGGVQPQRKFCTRTHLLQGCKGNLGGPAAELLHHLLGPSSKPTPFALQPPTSRWALILPTQHGERRSHSSLHNSSSHRH